MESSLVIVLAIATVLILLALRRFVFPAERDDPASIERTKRNLRRQGLRSCPHCRRFLPIAQTECPYCSRVSHAEA